MTIPSNYTHRTFVCRHCGKTTTYAFPVNHYIGEIICACGGQGMLVE